MVDVVQARWKGWSGMAADRPACSAPLQHCEDRRGGLLDGLVRAATCEMMMVSEHGIPARPWSMAPASFCFHLSIVRHEQLTTIDFQVTVYFKAVVEDTRSIYDIDRQCTMLLYGQWRATRYMYKVHYLNVACIHIYVSGVLIFACISSILVLH